MDLDAWLAPLDFGDGGAGSDLRSDSGANSPYRRLRDARSAARQAERNRDAEGAEDVGESTGWDEVHAVAGEILAGHSKDIEAAAWMTEALVRMHGLQGAAAGARLIGGLCDGFWDALFPQPDEDGLDGRRLPIEGLSGASSDGTLLQSLRMVPLFRRADGSGVGLYRWDRAEQVAALDEAKRQPHLDNGVPELSTLEAEARADRGYLQARGRELADAVQAWAELDATLSTRFGGEAPSLRKARSLLDRMLQVVTRLGGMARDESPAPEADVASPAADAQAVRAVAAGSPGVEPAGAAQGLTREGALRELDRIAEFFRRTEPHSPLAYTLEEAVRRGRMSLTELLSEVLPDPAARKDLMMRLGMRTDEG